MMPYRMTQKRSAVTPHSRARMTIVTHHGSRSYADSRISAVPVSALSAIGSATLPNDVTSDHFRAIQPSTKSVAEARQKTRQEATRAPVPTSPEAITMATKTGTSTIRSTVRRFAGLYSETTLGTVAGTGSSATCRHRVDHLHRDGDQVDALGPGHPGPDEVAGHQLLKIHAGFPAGQRGGAVDLGGLVLGAA